MMNNNLDLYGSPQPQPQMKLRQYMSDESTRVFQINGRELRAYLGKDTFPHERIFKLPTSLIESASVQPITSALLPCRIGYHPCARGQGVSRPNGDWAYTLLYCIEGCGTLDLPGHEFNLVSGDLALLRPFEFHAYSAVETDPWSYYWIHFNGSMAQQYFDAITQSGRWPCRRVGHDLAFLKSFERILTIYRDEVSYRSMVEASATMHQLLAGLYGRINTQSHEQVSIEARIREIVAALHENISANFSIQELAASANVSTQYFSHKFRQIMGESPRNYFNKAKVAKACDFLTSTDDKVETISSALGFSDPYYFSRLFKQIAGVAPSDYRREKRSLQPLALRN